MKKFFALSGLLATLMCGAIIAQDQKRTDADNKRSDADARDLHGRIVRVDAAKNTIVVRTGENDQAKEQELRVSDATKYWGNDQKALSDGLRDKSFREGTEVWWRMGTGDQARSVSELRFFNPSGTTTTPKGRNP